LVSSHVDIPGLGTRSTRRSADGTNAWNQWIRVMATLKQQNVHIQPFHVESLSCDMATETTKL